MKVLVDFDGVIVKRPGIPRPLDFFGDPPMEGALSAIQGLIERKHEVIVFTARPKEYWDRIKEWLKQYGFPELRITNIKEPATVYLDDRAVRFTSWQDFCKLYF